MKSLLFAIVAFIAVGCSASPKVEVKTEIVTNRTPPQFFMVNNLTNFICFTATNYLFRIYDEEICEGVRKERDELKSKVKDLTYPKNETDIQYVWSNTYFTVYEGTNILSGWTNNACISEITTQTKITQKIRTNRTVIVKEIGR